MKSRLRCYNQYPGLYDSIYAMTADLWRIKKMGFQQVWLNPFYQACRTNPLPGWKLKTQSPYAMQDERAIDSSLNGDEQAIKQYTAHARTLNLTPMFDLVTRHLAIDHRFVEGDADMKQDYNIDTRQWFKRHANGNLIIKGLDENYVSTGSNNPWADVAEFNYDNPKIRREIIEHFWKPFIYKNIHQLGFAGIRLDAPSRIPREVLVELVSYANEICRGTHRNELIVLAETVGSRFIDQDMDACADIATHTMNSLYWMPDTALDENYSARATWQDDGNWLAHTKGKLQAVAPTVGFAGSHDEPRHMEKIKRSGKISSDDKARCMREKLAVAALGSDGGWLLSYGDEFGVTEQVDLHDPQPIAYHKGEGDINCDVQNFVMELNYLLTLMPEPTYPEWNQRVFLDNYPHLVIFITHQGHGFAGDSFVTIANTDLKKPALVDSKMLQDILEANGRNDSPEKRALPNKLYLCGNLHPDTHIIHALPFSGIVRSHHRNAVNRARLFTPSLTDALTMHADHLDHLEKRSRLTESGTIVVTS